MTDSSKISIVIAIYNGAKTLEKCLQSIQMQTYSNIELIIMDGGSSDGTQSILESYESMITYWESKSDHGIYHAWNKALSHATGDWVSFIGSDDVFAYNDALKDMVGITSGSTCNYVSGKMKIDIDGQLITKGDEWNLRKMNKWMNVAHPGSLHHRSLFDEFGNFDDGYRIAGDYDFLLRVADSIKPLFLPRIVVLMGGEGVSHSLVKQALLEVYEIQTKKIGVIRAFYNLLIARLKSVLRKFK